MSIKSDWKETHWVIKLQMILMMILLPLLIIIAVDSCQRNLKESNPMLSTILTEQATP